MHYFNPLAPRGARRNLPEFSLSATAFQSTSSSRSQTCLSVYKRSGVIDFNPLAPRGARPRSLSRISGMDNFNPLAPRGARPCLFIILLKSFRFQSTSSSRSQTYLAFPDIKHIRNFNPLAPRGARPSASFLIAYIRLHFNPLAPRGARRAAPKDRGRILLISIH